MQFGTALYRQTHVAVDVDMVCSVHLALFLTIKTNTMYRAHTRPSVRLYLGFLKIGTFLIAVN